MAYQERPRQLSPTQDKAIAALLAEPTIRKAAELAGIGERTLHDWLDDPMFSEAYRHARKQVFQHGMSLCQKYVPHAVQTLVKVMADSGASHAAKVSAATALLKFGRESIEIDDLQARLEDLEQKIDAKPRRAFVDEQWGSDLSGTGPGEPPPEPDAGEGERQEGT